MSKEFVRHITKEGKSATMWEKKENEKLRQIQTVKRHIIF